VDNPPSAMTEGGTFEEEGGQIDHGDMGLDLDFRLSTDADRIDDLLDSNEGRPDGDVSAGHVFDKENAGQGEHSADYSDEDDLEDAIDMNLFRSKSWRQTVYLFFDEPSSSYFAFFFAQFILILILVVSFSFVMETHPYFGCRYMMHTENQCSHATGHSSDPTNELTCVMGQDTAGKATTDGLVPMVNNTFTPGTKAQGMHHDCEEAQTELECVGTKVWWEHDTEGGAGAACAWGELGE
jgi:hypothetical protein